MKLKIGKLEFNVKIAESDRSRKKGLKGVTKMPKGSGLVLSYSKEQETPITMEGMKIPIDIVFSRNGKVQEVRKADIGDDDIVTGNPSDLILEVNSGEAKDIKTGDSVEWVGEKNEDGTITMASGGIAAKNNQMQVLDENGKNQMNIRGSERIFSRKHTDKLVKLATNAKESGANGDFKKLGKAMVDIILKQDTQEQEYTKN